MRSPGGFISLSASRHEDNRADQLLRCNSGVWFFRKWSRVRLRRADGGLEAWKIVGKKSWLEIASEPAQWILYPTPA